MSFPFSIFLLAFLLAPVAAIPCPTGFTRLVTTGQCLKMIVAPLSYSDASAKCKSLGAKVLTIQNAIQNNAVLSFATASATGNDKDYWLGLQCTTASSSSCNWADGSKFSFDGFAEGQPNNSLGTCVFVGNRGQTAGQWFSAECGLVKTNVICEVN
ncbi:C-type lectin domain-containing protein [Caenorhabditis elegans]|uniref:C-type lectin domain-containing protein n=1 Tax=Caenorhabditis elegans TaxID=6239 RepID=P91214_CAEEL|nr:C-type lectin domain-containing protein [Caenorhabditis elegans]CCD64291.1 C-type lectin domain-containing protein [Caenorhabditis elegans]|eukprot:NP_504977.1 C-type LECtin [Caenorhabditis elegans]